VTEQELAVAKDRLDQLAAALLAASFKAMPRRLRRQYKGDTAVDGTPLKAASRGCGRDAKWLRWDLTIGYYLHVKDTGDSDAPKPGRPTGAGKGKPQTKTAKKGMQAHEAALVITCDSTPGERQYFPALALGLALGIPGVDPAGQAVRVFDRLAATGMDRRYLGVDRLYPFQKVEKWHQPISKLGWHTVHDYRIDQLGVVGTIGGALQVEGAFYCASMPQTLIDATIDERAGRITKAEYQQRVARRALYSLRQKESADKNGTTRWTCGAGTNAPIVRCDGKPASLPARVTRQPDGSRGDNREQSTCHCSGPAPRRASCPTCAGKARSASKRPTFKNCFRPSSSAPPTTLLATAR